MPNTRCFCTFIHFAEPTSLYGGSDRARQDDISMTRTGYEASTQGPEHLGRQIKHHAQTQDPFLQETNIFIQKSIYFCAL